MKSSSQKTGDVFQSSSAPKDGCYKTGDVTKTLSWVFQSSSAPKDGCYYPMHLNTADYWFQSSSAPKDGCYLTIEVGMEARNLFQSSSAPKDGCYRSCRSMPPYHICFNPHPPRRTDATRREGLCRRRSACFNPHPPRRTDATYAVTTSGIGTSLFQSSSAPKDGCYRESAMPVTPVMVFQSSSAPKDGCYWVCAGSPFCSAGFNPHPPRRTDATFASTNVVSAVIVSILIRPEGRMLPFEDRPSGPGFEVSILIRPEGRMLQPYFSFCEFQAVCVFVLRTVTLSKNIKTTKTRFFLNPVLFPVFL